MEVSRQPKLIFHGVDIVNINFNLLGPKAAESKIDVTCAPKIFHPDGITNAFKIFMDVDLQAEGHFLLSLNAIGNFEFDAELTDDLRTMLANSNSPAIMFPYIRSFITTLTANIGTVIAPIVIPPQFFKGALEEFKI